MTARSVLVGPVCLFEIIGTTYTSSLFRLSPPIEYVHRDRSSEQIADCREKFGEHSLFVG